MVSDPIPTVTKIVSGGQTGVDRAALDFALVHQLPCGGWCPNGRRAEDGVIDAHYPLQETPSDEYVQRTHWNIRDADGTLIINHGELSSGTLETFRYAQQTGKPVLVLDVGDPSAEEKFDVWLAQHKISVLNVAGPRESKTPGIYAQAQTLLQRLISLPQQQ